MDSIFVNINRQEKTLPERVADQIVQLILDEKLSSNEKLPNEFELAEQLNVGRGTVREAVKLLVSRNVLEIKRGRGTFICEQPGQVKDPFGLTYISDKKQLARDLMDVRIQIEPWVAALAARLATEEEQRRIVACFDAIDVENPSRVDYLDRDVAFHKSIADATHNIIAPKLIPVIGTYVRIAGRIGTARDTMNEHKAIVDAILSRDEEGAAEAMRDHLNSARKLL